MFSGKVRLRTKVSSPKFYDPGDRTQDFHSLLHDLRSEVLIGNELAHSHSNDYIILIYVLYLSILCCILLLSFTSSANCNRDSTGLVIWTNAFIESWDGPS